MAFSRPDEAYTIATDRMLAGSTSAWAVSSVTMSGNSSESYTGVLATKSSRALRTLATKLSFTGPRSRTSSETAATSCRVGELPSFNSAIWQRHRQIHVEPAERELRFDHPAVFDHVDGLEPLVEVLDEGVFETRAVGVEVAGPDQGTAHMGHISRVAGVSAAFRFVNRRTISAQNGGDVERLRQVAPVDVILALVGRPGVVFAMSAPSSSLPSSSVACLSHRASCLRSDPVGEPTASRAAECRTSSGTCSGRRYPSIPWSPAPFVRRGPASNHSRRILQRAVVVPRRDRRCPSRTSRRRLRRSSSAASQIPSTMPDRVELRGRRPR